MAQTAFTTLLPSIVKNSGTVPSNLSREFLYFYAMPMPSQNKKVAFSVTNCICNDQRVLKIAAVVCRLNCDIAIIGRKSGECCNNDSVPFKTKRFRMLFKKGFLFYAFFNIRLFFFLLFHEFDLLVANDLDTLLSNFLVSKLKKLPLVYDSHEYFTGVPELKNRPFIRRVWKSIERAIFPGLKYVVTVSDSIASLYEAEYYVRPIVIRNLGRNADEIKPFTRVEVGIPSEDLLSIIQGTGINIDKGAEELIEAIAVTEGVSLFVVGSGDVVPELKRRVTELSISHKVKFIPAVSWEILLKYTKTADVGMCIEKDTNLNYLYSLPNKLFDYLSAGIPVIAGNLPETRKIITENECGIIIPGVTPEHISYALTEFKKHPDKQAELKAKAVAASMTLNWDNESLKVQDLYRPILDNI
jgi:glycosyltransferase involved in cell wall biosynthesis